jgi:hypothetical protein
LEKEWEGEGVCVEKAGEGEQKGRGKAGEEEQERASRKIRRIKE